MAFGIWLGLSYFLSVWLSGKCADTTGMYSMTCQDRYLRIAVNLSFSGGKLKFEAVDATGVYHITKQYAAQCGYSISVFPLPGHVELRASYFSCHAENQDDKMFTFNFNLIGIQEGKEVTYALTKTCSPTLPWSPREVSCEEHYMEVSVRGDMTCPIGAGKDDWNAALTTAHASATSEWQVMFQRGEQQLVPITLAEAHKKGYVFAMTTGRIVFRTPYGRSRSFKAMVAGVPVEVVQPVVFARQSWVVLLVDLAVACTMYDGFYNGSSLVWETPQVMTPLETRVSGLSPTQVNMGANGLLLEQPIRDERGYGMATHDSVIHVSIPYNTEGGYRKCAVIDNLYKEYYIFHLYFEQLFTDEHHAETRLRLYRPLRTPLMFRPYSTVNQTVLEEQMFTVYLGGVTDDVALVAVRLNGQDFRMPFQNTSSHSLSSVSHYNYTHGYTLKVHFDDPLVIKQLSTDGILKYTLDINYMLITRPQMQRFSHNTSVVALMTNVFPPAYEAVCSEHGISFKADHRPFDTLWEVFIGPYPLTAEFAAEQGYILSNDTQSILLTVPLFTHGLHYENVGLETFSGTFALNIRDRKTLAEQSSIVKTCQFPSQELIVCSPKGNVTVVTDVSLAIPSGEIPSRTTLLDNTCGPKEADNNRVLYSFRVNTCGTRVKLGKDRVIYENEILLNQESPTSPRPVRARNATGRVTVQCSYYFSGLHRLFQGHRFDSDLTGIGKIIRNHLATDAPHPKLRSPTIKTGAAHLTTVLRTPEQVNATVSSPTARYIKVLNIIKDWRKTLGNRN